MDFETVIGLEVHAQLLTETKLFCGCVSGFGDQPNTHVCPVCLGLPGSLPLLNRNAVTMALRAALALECTIEKTSVFERKNYFYPDLPKGYQITQYETPLCHSGRLGIEVDGRVRSIGITRIHIEEDAGKLQHDDGPCTLLDANRCGMALIEIVSEPDMRSPLEAYKYLESLKQILSYLRICNCNMEEGSLRCDANISIRAAGEKRFGIKTELKNMNSFHNLVKALDYEANRQISVLLSGGKVIQETFLWDVKSNRTVSMRKKEDADDYRYFPEPDLGPLVINDDTIENIKASQPELPRSRINRFVNDYSLTPESASVIASDIDIADYFEEVIRYGCNARHAANWVVSDVLRLLNSLKCSISDLNITPSRLSDLIMLIDNNTISARAAKKVFDAVHKQNREPSDIIDILGLSQISDTCELESIITQLLDSNISEVNRYRSGDKKLLGFFVGQALKASHGKGNPGEISSILLKHLG